jgi:hypothetical protein
MSAGASWSRSISLATDRASTAPFMQGLNEFSEGKTQGFGTFCHKNILIFYGAE